MNWKLPESLESVMLKLKRHFLSKILKSGHYVDVLSLTYQINIF